MPLIRSVLDYLIYLIVRLMLCVIQSISMDTAVSMIKTLAWIVTYVIPVRRGVLKKNFDIAFPDLPQKKRLELIYQMWEHLLLMGVEMAFTSRKIHPTNWRHYIKLVNTDKIGCFFHQERSLIMITAHFGNFEAGGYFLGTLGYPSYAVARTLDNLYLDRFLKRFRESSGQYLVPKNEGPDQIIEILERKDMVAFLADQSAGPKGCWVDFFGHPASAYKAMALMSLKFDAPIIVCYTTRTEDTPLQFEIETAGILDPRNLPDNINNVKDITQWFTSLLEDHIRKKPNQYWWLHDRWKTYGKVFPPKKAG